MLSAVLDDTASAKRGIEHARLVTMSDSTYKMLSFMHVILFRLSKIDNNRFINSQDFDLH